MQLSNLLLLATSAMLVAPSLACKCIKGGQKDNHVTEICCRENDGEFQSGEDCKASSISESLSEFSDCCIYRYFTDKSDCPW